MRSIAGVEVDIEQWRENWRLWTEPLLAVRPIDEDTFMIGKTVCWYQQQALDEDLNTALNADEALQGTFWFDPGLEGKRGIVIRGLRVAQLASGLEVSITTNTGGMFPPWNMTEDQIHFTGKAINKIAHMKFQNRSRK